MPIKHESEPRRRKCDKNHAAKQPTISSKKTLFN